MGKTSVVVPKDFGWRVAAFLRHEHPHKTAHAVAAVTGCKVDAIEKWLEGVCAPNGTAVLRLFLAYGPEFICAVVDNPPAWLDPDRVEERQRALEASIAAQQAELAQLREARP